MELNIVTSFYYLFVVTYSKLKTNFITFVLYTIFISLDYPDIHRNCFCFDMQDCVSWLPCLGLELILNLPKNVLVDVDFQAWLPGDLQFVVCR